MLTDNRIDPHTEFREFLNGPIYWSASTGAHPVVNSFLNRWGAYQYEAGRLHYPTTDEIVLPDGGRRQEFQDGVIYVAFQNAIGAALFNGPVRDKYNTVGGLAPGGTLLGYPTQDQVGLPDGQGQMDRFQNGVIYWSPATNAHLVIGVMLAEWARNGYETRRYGYPVGEQYGAGPNTEQVFQKKKMTWLNQVAGVHRFTFQPQDPTYIKTDAVGKFSGQVDYSKAPDYYPMAWGMRLTPLVEQSAAAGGSTPMQCEAFRNENNAPTDYRSDYASPGKSVTVDYPLHSTVKFNKIGATEDLMGYCSFEDKSGGFSFVTWTFSYQVLDYNLPPPGGA